MKRYKIIKGKLMVSEDEKQNIGNCYYCKEPVWVSVGQATKYLRIDGKEIPTHKRCRKDAKKIKKRL